MRLYNSLDLNKSGDPPSFDDVLLVPTFTDVRSRSLPRTDASLGGVLDMRIPIISSPMDTVTDSKMAISLGSNGAIGIVHRFMSPRDQLNSLISILSHNDTTSDSDFAKVIPAIGVGKAELSRFKMLHGEIGNSLSAVAIDVANGNSSYMIDMIKVVQDISSGILPIIAGNVATGGGFARLAEQGVSAVRVGIGGGSICKTRIMTGIGVPTLSSVSDCYAEKMSNEAFENVSIIADGGIRYPADLVKSVAAGADAVMAGRIFAGTLESPGEVINVNGKKMKVYRGMASKEVQDDKRGGLRPNTCAEGVSTYIPLKGKAYYILEEFAAGMRSAMTYCNALNIDDLRNNARFIRLTSSALEESHAFGTKI